MKQSIISPFLFVSWERREGKKEGDGRKKWEMTRRV